MRWKAELSSLTSITVRKQKWVCHGCTGHCWESNCNADIILFQQPGFSPILHLHDRNKESENAQFCFKQDGLSPILLHSKRHHKYELRNKRVPVKKSPDRRGQQAKPWQPLQHLLY
jgi:hypothetical protein